MRRISRLLWCALAGLLLCQHAYAQVPLVAEAQTVAAPTQGVPLEYSFVVPAAGTYQVTLVDLGAQLAAPAPLAYAQLAITSGTSLVTLTGTNVVGGTDLSSPGSAQFSATAGTYVVHVIGTPGTGLGSGPVGIQITSTSGNTPVASFSGILALPPSAVPTNESVLDSSFTIKTAGTYQVTLSDLQLPQPLSALLLLIVQPGSATPTLTLSAAGSTSVSLQPGQYDVFAVGMASSTVSAGLFSVSVAASGSTPLYADTMPIGAVSLLGNPSLSAGSYTLAARDLAYPNALGQLGAIVVLNGQSAAQVAGAGQQTFTASESTYQVFGLATAGAAGAGSYAVTVEPQSGAAALSVARAVGTSSVSGYSFDVAVTAAGTYGLALADFGFPASFTTLSAEAVEGGTLLGSALSGVGTENLTVTDAGTVSLLVFAQPTQSGGLFGIDLNSGGTPLFETTQGVGQLFSSTQVSITTPGTYTVSVADLAFPATFGTLAVAVTRGTQQVGDIYGGGSFAFAATPGNYIISFVAQPTGTDQAGTYALTLAPSPAAPTVSFSADETSVSSGATVTLVWSSTGATSCSGSSNPAGVWSAGNLAASGQASSAAITAATTFTVTCTGAGGSTSQSVKVALSPSKGGGGAIGLELLLALAGALALRPLSRRHVRRPRRPARP